MLEAYRIPMMIKLAAHNPALGKARGLVGKVRGFLRQQAYAEWLERTT